MKQSTFKIFGLLLSLLPVHQLMAQSDSKPINVVSSAVPFLRISPDARAGGMGEVGVATYPDANSGFWNLAKTPFNEKIGGIGLTYTPWLKRLGLNDVFLATMAGFYRFDDLQAISGSLRYFSLGGIEFTGGSGEYLGRFNPREFSIDAGYSRKLSEKAGLGIALRYINSSLAKGDPTNTGTTYKAGNSVAGDLSFFYSTAGGTESLEGWNFGATLTNLGAKIGYTTDARQKDYIPANLALGTAYTKVYDESNRLTFGLDINKLLVPTPPIDENGNIPADRLEEYRSHGVVESWFISLADAPGGFAEEMREFQFSAGMEYWYQEQFALRAGYFYEDKTKGNRRYFTLGAGLKYNVFGLNFSYIVPSGSGINQNPLSNTLRFGIIFDFDAPE